MSYQKEVRLNVTLNFVLNIIINAIIVYFLNKSVAFFTALGEPFLFDMIFTGFVLTAIIFPIISLPAIKKLKSGAVEAIPAQSMTQYSIASKLSGNTIVAILTMAVIGAIIGALFCGLAAIVLPTQFNIYTFAIYKGIFCGILAAWVCLVAAPYALIRAKA